MMATWWIVGLLLVTFYTANLTASLAKPDKQRLIQNPRDLMRPELRHLKWISLEQHFIPVLSNAPLQGLPDEFTVRFLPEWKIFWKPRNTKKRFKKRKRKVDPLRWKRCEFE